MKQILIFFLVFMPVGIFSQIHESFTGPGLTDHYPWKGDLDDFFINSNKQLQMSSLKGEGEDAKIRLLYSCAPVLTWETEVKLDFKTTNSNHLRIELLRIEEEKPIVGYLQVGSNDEQITFNYGKAGSTPTRIRARDGLAGEGMESIAIRVILNENLEWSLYTRLRYETDFYYEGSIKSKSLILPPESYLTIESRNAKVRESNYYIDYIKITPEYPEKPGNSDGKLLINEVMAEPKGVAQLPETEYVELYNDSEEVLNLDGWTFWYGEKAVSLEPGVVPGNSYIVIYRTGRDIHIEKGGVAMPLTAFPSALNNNGKLLQIRNPAGNIIDEVEYPKAKAGLSWERSGSGWELCRDDKGGTPGAPNSVKSGNPSGDQPQPGEIILNELLINPFSGGSEYIELYNKTDKHLLLQDLAIATRKSDGSLRASCSLSDLNRTMEPNGYIVLTPSREGVIGFYYCPYEENILEVKIPVLANSASTVVLYRTTDQKVIDEVSYSSRWHHPSIKQQNGVALERINPDRPTQEASNWTSGAYETGYGTPGYRNSQENIATSIENIVKGPTFREGNKYEIEYQLDQPGYGCRMFIYDLKGIKVGSVINNELPATEGTLIWNGQGLNSRRLSPGVYILYIELYHSNGKTWNHKKVFLVH